jgi:hypothetical protein
MLYIHKVVIENWIQHGGVLLTCINNGSSHNKALCLIWDKGFEKSVVDY